MTRLTEGKRFFFACLLLGAVFTTAGCTVGPPPIPDFSLSAEEATVIYEENAEGLWAQVLEKYPDSVRPHVERVRSASIAERQELLAACMREKGYVAEAHNDNSFSVGAIPEAQEQTFYIDRYVCMVEYPYDAKLDAPVSDERLRYLYYYYTHDLTDCLTSHGFDSQISPPSVELFIEAIRGSSSSNPWDPYLAAGIVSPDPEIVEACPQYPKEYFGDR